MENKNITFVIGSLVGGGAEAVCVNIANGLAARGWHITIVVMHLKNAAYIDRVHEDVKVHSLNVSNARYAFIPLLKYFKQSTSRSALIFNYELAIQLVLIRKLLGKRIKLIARNINTISEKRKMTKSLWRKALVDPLIDLLYFRVDCVVNQCKGMEDDLLKIHPKLKGKSVVINNPVNELVEDYACNINLTHRDRENYILCIGRLEKQKAFHLAIEAFAEAYSQLPGYRLKIVGKGSLEQDLKSLAKQKGIENLVDFEGFQTNTIPYYIKARCTLLTSHFEGFPNVLVESISLGTPVISLDCPSGPSEIITTENGCLVEKNNNNELVKAMLKVLNKEWDVKSVKQSSDRFSLQAALMKYQTVLQ